MDSINTTRTPSYTLVNVKLGYQHEPWNLGQPQLLLPGRRPGLLRLDHMEVELMRRRLLAALARLLAAATAHTVDLSLGIPVAR